MFLNLLGHFIDFVMLAELPPIRTHATTSTDLQYYSQSHCGKHKFSNIFLIQILTSQKIFVFLTIIVK